MFIRKLAPVALMLAPLLGCSDTESGGDAVAQSDQWIINGTPDTTHHAVVAIFASQSACSGTIIHVDPNNGIGHAITAAHCQTPQVVIQGNDYNNPTAVYQVIGSQNHPAYNGQVYDFKMVRFTGASGSTPVIPAMSPAQDNLSNGTQIRHVGYGKAGPPPGTDNTIRRQILGNVGQLSSTTIEYNQPSGGPCSGDSGGPQLTTGTELVAGVTSQGDQNCASYGMSGRVSAVYDTFIMPYINDAPIGPLDCDGCFTAATTGQGACMGAVNSCFNNSACSALVECFNGCSTNSCYLQCQNDHAAGIPLYNAIFDCVCDSACTSECGSTSTCTGSSSSSSTSSSSTSSTSSSSSGGGGEPIGGGGSVGAGGSGAGAPNDGWVAGSGKDEGIDGYIQSSTCSTGHGSRGGGGWWILLGVLGAGALRRRRITLSA